MNNTFKTGNWEKAIDVRDFIVTNITPYDGDDSFLVGPSEKTQQLWSICKDLLKKEFENGGVLAIDADKISTIISHDAGYIKKDLEVVVGLQTDAPLKRAIKPFGGIGTVVKACEQNNVTLNPQVVDLCTEYRKTHNQGVFDVYTEEMRKLRKIGVLTGLPDNYARGRIVGDYRRVALYGIDRLIEEKIKDKDALDDDMNDETIRLREELSEQIKALTMMKEMASFYGMDISKPAANAYEAVQWTYFAYLAALKEHDGAAMSLGNVSSFFDIYIEKDMAEGKMTEDDAQELIDQFIIKLRMIRHLRMEEYNDLFAGDPAWLTESIGGMLCDGRHKVTKSSYRFLHTLYNLDASPEPNITILWSQKLPENFKKFCAKVSIDTSSIQYENDDLMRETACTDDYGISCCVSLMDMGKQMQFFGARCNLAKALLMAINEGKDENAGIHVVDDITPLKGEYLDYDQVMERFKITCAHLATAYVKTMNVIHYMHDKYFYERAQMALIDTKPKRVTAYGIAGLSVVADSLSAIKYAKVKPIRNEAGIAIDFQIEGDFPKYGNDDDRVDEIAKWCVKNFNDELSRHHIYRDAQANLSVLTITSNVVYGKKTGATPDGRKAGVPFAPGANPMHGRDSSGAIASLNSVAKLQYGCARDGISNTFSAVGSALGADKSEQVDNLVDLMGGYFGKGAHHLNVNVLTKQTLEDAMAHPENYPQLTIRVSGYAVNFVKLSREQQLEVLSRTFFDRM